MRGSLHDYEWKWSTLEHVGARLVCATVLLGGVACVEHATRPASVVLTPPADTAGPSTPPSSLREVHWGDREYTVAEWSVSFALRDGRMEVHEYPVDQGAFHTTDLWLLEAVGYGDLDGDGAEEAVVVLSHTSLANAEEREVRTLQIQVFAMQSGVVALLASRAAPAGKVQAVLVSRGQVTLERTGDRALRLRFAGGELTLVDPPIG